jgi:hypothetical protein
MFANATNANAIYEFTKPLFPTIYTTGFPEFGLRYGDFALSTSPYR